MSFRLSTKESPTGSAHQLTGIERGVQLQEIMIDMEDGPTAKVDERVISKSVLLQQILVK